YRDRCQLYNRRQRFSPEERSAEFTRLLRRERSCDCAETVEKNRAGSGRVQRMIYLDYNATTPLCDAAREAMLPYFSQHFGNPSSIHRAGRNAPAAVDNGRDKIAALIRAKPNEIIFTSGATESCNLAVLGLARCRMDGGGHIISNKTEHHAVLHAVEHLEKHENFEVTWLDT